MRHSFKYLREIQFQPTYLGYQVPTPYLLSNMVPKIRSVFAPDDNKVLIEDHP